MFGSVCSEREKLTKVCNQVSKLSAAPIRFEDLFPSIKGLSFLTGRDTVLKGLVKDIDDVLDILIAQRENGTTFDDEDLLGLLLKIKTGEIYNAKLQITNHNIKAIIFELLLPATVTVADVVEWAMVQIIRHPQVLKQVKEELKRVLDGKQEISGSDLEKMEYLHMCVKESTRLHPAAPLLFPREAREEFQIDNYTIPKGSWIMTNYWAIGRDPEIWPNPDQFDPERFRNSNMDLNGNHFELIPFGTGRRRCPGISFGITEAEFLLAALFYHFDWELPGGITPDQIDMTELFDAGCILKNPLTLIPVVPEN
ncbi:hypothetical protein M9H77_13505 [Catharanthus roseus]|uniref:Uncharacterized protein n=1 Tax=Catharanthus roseus TaxID=4058 RepID=A0ACC0BKD7_CATRO|nr:hypothetical protein M9H77_13505 [Catharanthus roseus]